MTMRELYQLSNLKREISEQRERLERLKQQSTTISCMNGVQNGGNPADKVGSIVSEKVALEQLINQKIDEYWSMYVELEVYISNISDSFIRRIFRMRFIDGLSWNAIALKCGGNQAGNGIRMICKRFLENN